MIFNKKTRNLAILLIFMMVIGVLAGCTETKPTETEADNQEVDASNEAVSQTLVLGAQNDFKSASEAASLVFDFMTAFEENMDISSELSSALVKSWEIKNDGATYILHLQEGVKFHNGEDFNAEVAKFSIEYWGPYANANYPKYLKEIKVVDDTTLEVNFHKTFSPFLMELGGIRATLPDTVDDKGIVVDWQGTGPFVLKDYTKDQKAVLELNTDYWNKEKMPTLQEVVWQAIPNENSRVMALKSGQVDAIGLTEHHISMPYAVVGELENTSGIKVLKPTEEYLSTTETYVFNYKKGLLVDLNLRKAIVHAIDRETLTAKLLHNVPTPTGHFVLPAYIDGPKNVEEYSYNTTVAKAALEAAGYKTTNASGIVEKDGKPLQLTLLARNDQTARDVAVYLQSNLKEVGIDVVIDSVDRSIFDEKAKSGEFDIAFTHAWTVPPVRYMQWRGLSDSYDVNGIGFKVDPKIDGLVETVITATDKKDHDQAWEEIWETIYNFYPGTSLFVRARVLAHKDNISGLYFHPRSQTIDLSNVVIN
ncbi:ABC-type dipeptide transport system, periplasmic component [Clostridium aceticum]|uniref:ABC-type dipeptide transport system, periplasmic component n=1 Tax=Clostridium aceticum TaxID=84022 RepID=A0A0D8I930_9CLOT|nr:ABC transporter substrate-binding protein [Clostridium aceticum]AKL95889.1 ABC-type dipeptide transport system, periplasmic component [Clostridium aceticum]KJF26527.1 hypothetical protein TZ02_12645 [Clostridium aceticum]